MANADKTLLDKDEKEIYPITRERNVYDENNVNLKEKFKNVVFKDNEVHKFAEKLHEESSNIWNEEWEVGGLKSNGTNYDDNKSAIRSKNYILVKPNTNYYIVSTATLYVFTYDKNKNKLGEYSRKNNTLLIPNNVEYVRFATSSSYGNVYKNDIAIIEGTSGEYHPYNPNRHITNIEAEFLKEEFDKQVNMFDKNKSQLGKVINVDTGVITQGSGITFISELIEIETNQDYIISGNGTVEANKKAVFFDSYMKYISGNQEGGTNDTYVFKTPSNAKYVVIQGLLERINYIQLEKGTVATPYQPYNSSSHITNAQADLLNSEWEKGLNMYDGITLKGNIVSSNNTIDSTSVDRLISGSTYEIKPNTNYFVNFEGLDRYDAYCYNSNMQLIGDSGWVLGGKAFQTPSAAKYLRITFSYNDNKVINSANELKNVYLSEFGEIIHRGDITPTVLFEGASNGNLTLIDDVENYEYVKIYYDVGNSEGQNSIEVLAEKLLEGNLCIFGVTIDGSAFPNKFGIINHYKKLTIRGKNLTVEAYGRWWQYKTDNSYVIDAQNQTYITKILGYKGV